MAINFGPTAECHEASCVYCHFLRQARLSLRKEKARLNLSVFTKPIQSSQIYLHEFHIECPLIRHTNV
jgi:hypothetical protein